MLRSRWSALAVAGVFAVACSAGDAAGPAPFDESPLVIDIQTPGYPVFEPGVGVPTRVTCTFILHTLRHDGSEVTWSGATFRYFAGPDRHHPIDSSILSAADVHPSWRARTGATTDRALVSGWDISASVPFTTIAEFRYRFRDGGPEHSSSIELDCGPANAASTVPPTIAGLRVRTSADTLRTGDSVFVDLALASDAGLWQTVVRITGPCTAQTTFFESLHPAATHTVRFTLPATCNLGVPLSAAVIATDALLQDVTSTVTSPYVIGDNIPPVLDAGVVDWAEGCCPGLPIIYFGGDSLQFNPNASDNRALRWIAWELLPLGIKDSAATGFVRSVGQLFSIPIPSAYVGPLQLRVRATDDAGLSSAVYTSPAGKVQVFPNLDRPFTTATTRSGPKQAVLDTKRGAVYLLGAAISAIEVIPVASHTVTETIALPGPAAGFDLTAGGDSLVVLFIDSATLGVVDLRAATRTVALVPLTGLTFGGAENAFSIASAPNGKIFVGTAGDARASSVYEVDFSTNTQRRRPDAGVPSTFAVSAQFHHSGDRSALFSSISLAGYSRYMPATDTFVPVLAGFVAPLNYLPGPSRLVPADLTGQRVAVGPDVYDISGTPIAHVIPSVARNYGAAQFSADGQYLYGFSSPYGMVRSRLSDGSIVDRTQFPALPASTLLSPDGTLLVIVSNVSPTGVTSVFFVDMR